MKRFSELLEDKVERQLTSLAPKAPGEQHFVDKHKIDSVNDKFLVPDNGIFGAGKKVKTFPRKVNRFGNDQFASIKKFDENVSLADRVINAHKKKKVRHLLDKDGRYVGTELNAKTNKEAMLNHIRRAATKHAREKLAVVKEDELDEAWPKEKPIRNVPSIDKYTGKSPLGPNDGYSRAAVDKEIKKDPRIKGKEAKMIHAVLKGWRKESVEATDELTEAKKEKFAIGDNVHLGLRVKGGAGFRGKVTGIDEHDRVTIERPKDPALDKYYPKTYTGHKSLCTKEETINEDVSKDAQKRFANSSGKMKPAEPKDSKDKFKAFLDKKRGKKVNETKEEKGKDVEKAEKELHHLEHEVERLKKKKKGKVAEAVISRVKEYMDSQEEVK